MFTPSYKHKCQKYRGYILAKHPSGAYAIIAQGEVIDFAPNEAKAHEVIDYWKVGH